MLLCRRIIRAHTLALSNQRLPQVHVCDRSFLNIRTGHASLVTHEIFPKATELQTVCSDEPLFQRVLRISRYSVPRTSKNSKSVEEDIDSGKNKHDPFDAYTELRTQYPSLLTSLPTDVLCRLAEKAVKYGSQDLVDGLTADVLADNRLDTEQRAHVAAALLCLPRHHSSLLNKQTTLSLLTLVHRSGQISDLPPQAALHIINSITPLLDESLVNLVISPFLEHLASLPSPPSPDTVDYQPPRIILMAFKLIDKLIMWKRFQDAFDLLQTVSDCGHLPRDVLQYEVSSPLKHDFAVIARSMLARSCFHWSWHHHGVGFVVSIMQSQDSLTEDLVPLTLKLLHAALVSCSSQQFQACTWLMCRLVRSHRDLIIPSHIFQLYYTQALALNDRESARLFYSHTQSHPQTKYPPPRNAPLVWLMTYLAEQKHDVHLARCLAKQVVENWTPIPPNDCGRFIALTANRGFATEARALWERYEIGPDRALVVGNAATMLRMVSLFTKRDSLAKFGRPKLLQGSDRTPDYMNEEERSDDYKFAYRVLLAFQETIMPLEETGHFNLSALARGYFMLGETAEALRPFKTLMVRREVPDGLDINIALGGMANQEPRAAYRTLNRMIRLGVQPTGSTFGTVLHQAIVHGDAELVTEILNRAQTLGVALSSKVLFSLIRSSVAVTKGVDEESLEANVKRAWDVVQAEPESSVVRTPNMGKCCIIASLHLRDPVMAYKFWALLVRNKAEWKDREQIKLREQIGKMVRRHCAEGWLELERGRLILRQLGGGVVDK